MRPHAPPTVRQIYALAAALCVRVGVQFPDTRFEASELIGDLRAELGMPDAPGRGSRSQRALERELHDWAVDDFLSDGAETPCPSRFTGSLRFQNDISGSPKV
jgi:hypothetical protein